MPDLGAATGSTLAVLFVLLLLPGLLIGVATGLRGWLLAAGAPLLTFGLISAIGPALPVVGATWNPVALAVSAVLTAAVAVGLRIVLARTRGGPPLDRARTPWRIVDHVAVAGAVLVSAGVGVTVMAGGTEGFTAIPQFWDTAFHSNAIRYIVETGASAPSALGALSGQESFYYPNSFHLISAMLVTVTGIPVTAGLSIVVALAPGVFALGVAALVRTVSGRPSVAIASALLACAFSGFPYDLASVLLPYVIGLALLPVFLGQWVDLLAPDRRERVLRAVALGLATVGLLGLHPSTVVAGAVLAVAYLAQLWWHRRPVAHDAVVIGIGAGATIFFGVPLLIASASAAAGESFDWPIAMPSADAVGRLLTLAHGHEFPQWWLAVPVALGILGLRRHPELRWLAVSALVFGVIFVMAASYEGRAVDLLSRPWWNDRWRLVALWVVAVVPLAGAGLVAVRDGAVDLLRRARVPEAVVAGRGRLLPAALLVVLLFTVVAQSEGLYRERNTERIAEAYTDGPAVSRGEADAFTRLAAVVPPDARVMNDPYDGSPMMYALAGVRPVFPQPVHEQLDIAGLTPERRLLFTSFHEIDDNAQVRDVVRQMNITHAVVSEGLVYTAPGPTPGTRDLAVVDSLHLLFETPTTTVYEVRLADDPAAG